MKIFRNEAGVVEDESMWFDAQGNYLAAKAVHPTKGRFYTINHVMRFFNPYNVQEDADKTLEEWDDVCNALDIIHFLMFGTCLGFYRDDGYIPHDTDIDVGLVCTGTKYREMAAALQSLGWYGAVTENLTNDPREMIKYPRELMVCIPRLAEGPPPWTTDHYAYKWQIEAGPFVFESFDTVAHHGREYKVIHPVEDYLAWVYGGESWRTPEWREP